MAQAGQGRFADAIESWDRWTRADGRQPDEDTHAPAVARLREAAATLADALRARHV